MKIETTGQTGAVASRLAFEAGVDKRVIDIMFAFESYNANMSLRKMVHNFYKKMLNLCDLMVAKDYKNKVYYTTLKDRLMKGALQRQLVE